MELRLSRTPIFVPSATLALISLFASFVPAVAALLFLFIFLEVEISYFLSIYETKPVESQLDVFWETSTTGLISALNEDVQTGYDGIVGFTTLNYTHFENQDPQGTSLVTGAEDSKFITDSFYAIDGQGTQQAAATISSFSVTDDDGNTRTSDFELIQNYNLLLFQKSMIKLELFLALAL